MKHLAIRLVALCAAATLATAAQGADAVRNIADSDCVLRGGGELPKCAALFASR